jgi:hypothetical protein
MKFLLMIAAACAMLVFMLLDTPDSEISGTAPLLPRESGRGNGELLTIEDQAAADAIARYRLIEIGSSSARRCQEARAAVEALSRTRFDAQYEGWKETEAKECAAAERSGQRYSLPLNRRADGA